MEKELGELREKVNSVENKREPFNDQGETECLEVVKKEEERKHQSPPSHSYGHPPVALCG